MKKFLWKTLLVALSLINIVAIYAIFFLDPEVGFKEVVVFFICVTSLVINIKEFTNQR